MINRTKYGTVSGAINIEDISTQVAEQFGRMPAFGKNSIGKVRHPLYSLIKSSLKKKLGVDIGAIDVQRVDKKDWNNFYRIEQPSSSVNPDTVSAFFDTYRQTVYVKSGELWGALLHELIHAAENTNPNWYHSMSRDLMEGITQAVATELGWKKITVDTNFYPNETRVARLTSEAAGYSSVTSMLKDLLRSQDSGPNFIQKALAKNGYNLPVESITAKKVEDLDMALYDLGFRTKRTV